MFKNTSKKVLLLDLIKNGADLQKQHRVYLLTDSRSVITHAYYADQAPKTICLITSDYNTFFVKIHIILHTDLHRYIVFYINKVEDYKILEFKLNSLYHSILYPIMGFFTYFTRGATYSSQDAFDNKYREIMNKHFLRKLNTLRVSYSSTMVNRLHTAAKKYFKKQNMLGPYEVPDDMTLKMLYNNLLTNIIEDDLYGTLKKTFPK